MAKSGLLELIPVAVKRREAALEHEGTPMAGRLRRRRDRGHLARRAMSLRNHHPVAGVFVEFVPQRADRDAENPGGMGPVATAVPQRLQDQFALDIGDGTPDERRRLCAVRFVPTWGRRPRRMRTRWKQLGFNMAPTIHLHATPVNAGTTNSDRGETSSSRSYFRRGRSPRYSRRRICNENRRRAG